MYLYSSLLQQKSENLNRKGTKTLTGPHAALGLDIAGVFEFDRQSQLSRTASTAGSCRINRLLFGDDLVLLASSERGLQYHLFGIPQRAAKPE